MQIDLEEEALQGDYILKVMMGGSLVTLPKILVDPCSNLLAFEQGLLPGAGGPQIIVAPDYEISTAPVEVPLASVPLYCL